MKQIRHTGITVSDMESALRFYRDLLGLKVAKDFKEGGNYIDSISGLSGVRVWMVKLTVDDGSMVELLQYLSHPGKVPDNPQLCDIGRSHISFTVENLDCEYKRLKKIGVKFNRTPQISPDGKAKVVFCRDPEGNFIELVEEIT